VLFRDVTLKRLINAHIFAIKLVANSSDALTFLRKATASTAKKPRRRAVANRTAVERQIG
jgi:hypothetical protein